MCIYCSDSDVSTHRQRNYLFDLDAAVALDSDFAGNGSRYINHSEKDCNCRAQGALDIISLYMLVSDPIPS